MVVMNDRPQAGTAFRPGRAELMFNRRGMTSDSLGMDEPLNEIDMLTMKAIRTHNRYWVGFTEGARKQAFDMIFFQTAKTLNPIQLFKSDFFELSPNTYDAQAHSRRVITRQGLVSYLLSKDVINLQFLPDYEAKTLLLRLQIYVENTENSESNKIEG